MVEAFKKAGLKVTFHSHGNIMPLFQDLVEVDLIPSILSIHMMEWTFQP